MPSYTGRKRKLIDLDIVNLYLQGLASEAIGIHAVCSGTTALSLIQAKGKKCERGLRQTPGRQKPLILSDGDIVARYSADLSDREVAFCRPVENVEGPAFTRHLHQSRGCPAA